MRNIFIKDCLPLCIIDSVFSIEVTYTSTRNIVLRYCKYFDLKVYRDSYYELPTIEKQESISINAKDETNWHIKDLLRKYFKKSKDLLLEMGY